MAYVLTTLIIFILDQLTKSYVITHFDLHRSVSVINHILSITYSRNTGGAFSILNKYPAFFLIPPTLLIVASVLYFRRIKALSIYYQLALGLILGGAMGNLADRICFGGVIDFIHFSFWPTFNVADIAVTVGVGIMVIILMIYGEKEKSTTEMSIPPSQSAMQIKAAQGKPKA
jgi:signal peptidase II